MSGRGGASAGPGEVGDLETDRGPTPSRGALTGRWRRVQLSGVIAYLLTRVFVVGGAAAVSTARDVTTRLLDPTVPIPGTATSGIIDVLNSWDGQWYYRVIRDGYPRHVPPGVNFNTTLEARAAFFPLYPLAVRVADTILPGGDVFAALFLNLVLGLVAVLLVGTLARRLYDDEVAERAMILMAVFPGSFVLSFAYTEALMVVLAAGCMLALLRRRWLLAGVLAAFVTAARPNGIAIVFACAVASVLAIRSRREWRSLVAPALAPVGWITFQLWLSWHAGERWVWFRVQREAWHEGVSLGMTALRGIGNALVHPLSSPTNLLTLVTVAAMIAMVGASIAVRLSPLLLAYSAAVLALMLTPATVTARPRFLYTAFPLLIGVAAWWPARWRNGWGWMMAACGAGLVILPVLYGGFAAIP